MIKTTLSIDGMMCGMCESHINDVVRRAMAVKKVTSSHAKGETVIISDVEPDIEALKKAIGDMGYTVSGVSTAPCEKKGLFGWK